MVLPNLYFFARSTRNLAYLDKSTDEVLGDLADFLGGPRHVLVPAWKCLELPLSELTLLEGQDLQLVSAAEIRAGEVRSQCFDIVRPLAEPIIHIFDPIIVLAASPANPGCHAYLSYSFDPVTRKVGKLH